MFKYYTRACNFYHGKKAKELIKKKLALSLCGNKKIAFDHIEIFNRKKQNISTKLIHIKKIKNLKDKEKKVINRDLKKITSKRK